MTSLKRIQTLTGHLVHHHDSASSSLLPPLNVVVTGAAGNICYSLLFMVAQGEMLGAKQPIHLRLLDIPPMADKMKGVEMELRDCAFPLLASIVATTDYRTAFEDVDVALLVGARPRGPGMERKDLLAANAKIFAGQGEALNRYASGNVKVCVVGNPANTNALIAMKNAPRIPAENFTAMTRLDQNRAIGQVSQRVNAPVRSIKNVVIWGNHSSTQYPDVDHGFIDDFPIAHVATPIRTAINDDQWVSTEFIRTVQKRGAAIIKARGSSSAASAANAAVSHVRSWLLGTPTGEWVSMGVLSNGEYDTPDGVIFSFPCTCTQGKWSIVPNLQLSAFAREKIRSTGAELVEERRAALGQ